MIDTFLKQAEITYPESATKMAEIASILDNDFLYKSDFVKWAQEFLEDVDSNLEKIAIDWVGAGKSVGNTALKGLGIAGAGAASMVGAAVISDMYGAARLALTKSHNFNKMVEADPSLHDYPAEKVKAYFTTLHEKGGPEISGDPLMASAFVKAQLDFHGNNIMDQVGKIVSMRSSLSKINTLPKLDFSAISGAKSLLNSGSGQGSSGKPSFSDSPETGNYHSLEQQLATGK